MRLIHGIMWSAYIYIYILNIHKPLALSTTGAWNCIPFCRSFHRENVVLNMLKPLDFLFLVPVDLPLANVERKLIRYFTSWVLKMMPKSSKMCDFCLEKSGFRGQEAASYGDGSKPIVPLVNIKIAGKWMFIPLKMVLIGIDPYPYGTESTESTKLRLSQRALLAKVDGRLRISSSQQIGAWSVPQKFGSKAWKSIGMIHWDVFLLWDVCSRHITGQVPGSIRCILLSNPMEKKTM